MRGAKIYSETIAMAKNQESRFKIGLLAGVLASNILVLQAGAQSPAPAGKPPAAAHSIRYRPDPFAGRAGTFEPSLIDPQAGVKLVVPALEQVGQLRQSAPPEAGKVYWMAFSNKGRRVKRGDRVNVVIGRFHADGLVVE